MHQFPQLPKAVGQMVVPRHARAICVALALLLPFLGAVPDIPFRPWHSVIGGITHEFGLVGYIIGVLFLAFLAVSSISPVLYFGVVLEHCALAFWLSLAAYLCAALMGYGAVNRVLGGDGLELVIMLMFTAFAAGCGGIVGFLLHHVISSVSIQRSVVRIAFTAAFLGSLTWSVMDAATFAERKQAWQENRQSYGRAKAPGEPRSYALPETPMPVACLGHASADRAIRLFNENECTVKLRGKYYPNGECLKTQGGSYSWDLRSMNQSCG